MDIYTLNGKDYQILDILTIGERKYAYLGMVDDAKKVCIRRIEDTLEGKAFVGLDDKEEFNIALKEFERKYKDLVVLDN